jgi:hypothetical protein
MVKPRCGWDFAVLSIFTARTGPFGLPFRPASSDGSVGVGVGVGDTLDGDSDGVSAAGLASGSEEQAATRRAAASRAARGRVITPRR